MKNFIILDCMTNVTDTDAMSSEFKFRLGKLLCSVSLTLDANFNLWHLNRRKGEIMVLFQFRIYFATYDIKNLTKNRDSLIIK